MGKQSKLQSVYMLVKEDSMEINIPKQMRPLLRNPLNNNNKMLVTFFKPLLLPRRATILLALSLYQVHQIRKLRTLNT